MKNSRPLLAFGKESVDKYKEINHKLFNDELSNKDLFLLAVAFGVFFAQRVEKFDKAPTGPRTELSDDDLLLLRSIAFGEAGNQEQLPSDQTRNEIAVQLAEGGVRLIHGFVADKTPEHARAAFLREFQKTLGM